MTGLGASAASANRRGHAAAAKNPHADWNALRRVSRAGTELGIVAHQYIPAERAYDSLPIRETVNSPSINFSRCTA